MGKRIGWTVLGAFAGFAVAVLVEAITGLRGDLPTLALLVLTFYGGVRGARKASAPKPVD